MPRTRRVAAVALLSLSAFAAAACGAGSAPSAPPAAGSAPDGSGPAGSASAPAPAAGASPSGASAFATAVGTRVGLASVGSLGPVLVDEQGRTLYLDGADTTVHATCLDECAKSWPPVTTPGFPLAGPGVDDGLLGAAALADGTAQVLYKGHPLYRFAGDRGPGEAAGHTVADPHGTFYAVTSLGDPVGVDISTLHGAGGVPSGAASPTAGGSGIPFVSAAPSPPATPSAAPVTPAVPTTPLVPYVPATPSAPAVVQPPDTADTDPGTAPEAGDPDAGFDDGAQDG
ncbi:hypothetical protein [Kitasatospora sp. NPDC004531]